MRLYHKHFCRYIKNLLLLKRYYEQYLCFKVRLFKIRRPPIKSKEVEMKKYLIAGLTLISSVEANMEPLQGKEIITARSYLFTRPAYQGIGLHQSLWHNILLDTSKKGALLIAPVYQKSIKPDDIKTFFLPPQAPVVNVTNQESFTNMLPFWLGLPDDFTGNFTFAPRQQQAGFLIEYRHMIGDFLEIPFFANSWIDIQAPVMEVRNNMHFTQSDVENAPSSTLPVHDIISAFNNPTWDYSKISNASIKKMGLSEIRLAIGTTFLSTERGYVATYSALSLPTGNKFNDLYMFTPQTGYNGYVGIIWGALLECPLTQPGCRQKLSFQLSIENNWLIRNHQYRTFDINGKPWSRFLLFRQQYDTENNLIPGVNVMTQKVRISPHSVLEFSAGLRGTMENGFQAEIGYNLWGFGGESLRMTSSWSGQYGIAGTNPNTSSSGSNIHHRAANDTHFKTVLLTDIDLNSGLMPSALIQRLYGSAGFIKKGPKKDFTLGLGGSLDIPQNSTKSLFAWSLWFNVGAGF